MSGFAPSGVGVTGLDPHKRVNYRLGLVLGEDEFRQDQFHHRERDQHATRALHGYGTVSGLRVHFDDTSTRLHVQPGLAIDPAGRLICVPVEYCGSLAAWLADELGSDGVSGLPPSLSVYVVLCWTECETDDVPIPAGSCLSAEDSRAASRLLDSFQLRLSLAPPPDVGETASTSVGDSLQDLVDQLHGLLDVSAVSPPDTEGVATLLREWAVTRRPEVVAGTPCLPVPADTCVLLARVDVDLVDGSSDVDIASAVVDESDRPILVSTRLLQEALFAAGADVVVPDHRHALAALEDVDLSVPPVANAVLTFDGGSWASGMATNDHGSLVGRDDDDHPQYLLVNGGRGLGGDLSADGNRLTNLPPSTADGQAIVHGQGAGGDLQGTYPDPTLARIQGIPVAAPAPVERDALLIRGGQWQPGRPWALPFATVLPHTKERVYVVWFNLDAPENNVEVDEGSLDGGLEVLRETDAGSFLRRVGPTSVTRSARNVYLAEVREDNTPLRFTFDLSRLRLTDGTPVRDWADKLGIWFLGQGAKPDGVTVFTFRPDRLEG